MSADPFSQMSNSQLVAAADDRTLGLRRALAIETLALRAIQAPELLPDAVKAIATDRGIGFHKGAPAGWLGADAIFRSGNKRALGALLQDMTSWTETEQEDLVSHWAGRGRLAELTQRLSDDYGWRPAYRALDDQPKTLAQTG